MRISLHKNIATKAFTLVELLATIAIAAMLSAIAIVYIGDFVTWSRQTADQQSLAVLNDALTRYKTEGGNLNALTIDANKAHIIEALATPVDWNGMTHQFIRTGQTFSASSLRASGEGRNYKFTGYGSHSDSADTSTAIISSITTLGSDVGNATDFKTWLANAMIETGSTNYMIFSNPSSTTSFQIDVTGVSDGHKIMVWWADGSTDTFTTGGGIAIAKNYAEAANRGIVVVGDVSTINSAYDDGRTNFGGDLTNMKTLTDISLWANNTIGGRVTDMTGLKNIGVGGNPTLGGDISNLTQLEAIDMFGNNTLTGSITNLANLYHLNLGGNNTLSGNVTNLTNLDCLAIWNTNTVTGDVSGLTSLIVLRAAGGSTMTGSLDGLTALTSFLTERSNHFTGDLTGRTGINDIVAWGDSPLTGDLGTLINLTFLDIGEATQFTGDVSGLTKLDGIAVFDNNAITGLGNLAMNSPNLSMINFGGATTLDEAEVNAVFAGIRANLGNKVDPWRHIGLANGSNASPTGQGIIDMNYLVNNEGWSVYIN